VFTDVIVEVQMLAASDWTAKYPGDHLAGRVVRCNDSASRPLALSPSLFARIALEPPTPRRIVEPTLRVLDTDELTRESARRQRFRRNHNLWHETPPVVKEPRRPGHTAPKQSPSILRKLCNFGRLQSQRCACKLLLANEIEKYTISKER
jgi:hypothetical protein